MLQAPGPAAPSEPEAIPVEEPPAVTGDAPSCATTVGGTAVAGVPVPPPVTTPEGAALPTEGAAPLIDGAAPLIEGAALPDGTVPAPDCAVLPTDTALPTDPAPTGSDPVLPGGAVATTDDADLPVVSAPVALPVATPAATPVAPPAGPAPPVDETAASGAAAPGTPPGPAAPAPDEVTTDAGTTGIVQAAVPDGPRCEAPPTDSRGSKDERAPTARGSGAPRAEQQHATTIDTRRPAAPGAGPLEPPIGGSGAPQLPTHPQDRPVAPSAPAPAPTSTSTGSCAGAAMPGAGHGAGGGSGNGDSAMLEDVRTTELGRSWARLTADIAARVLTGADSPASRPD